ncbi:hypothetical protein JCM6882_002091 [Rhodosporidiobolus microsporus]
MRPSLPSQLKLLALPLTRPSPSSSGTTPRFYLHALKSSLSSPAALQRQQDSQPAYLAYANKAINKAADLWAGLGQAQGGWKKKIYDTGERMMDKIEYEEWALKAIDPALAPKPWQKKAKAAGSSSSSSSSGAAADEKVEILFPPSLLTPSSLLSQLHSQLEHRAPHHRSAAIRCLVLSPLTWPFAIIPVIPNLPLFYVLWRAWSHYKAHKASAYLLDLLPSSASSSSSTSPSPSTTSPSSLLQLKPSDALDEIYSQSSSTSSSSASPSAPATVLLNNAMVSRLAERFHLSTEERKELERAVLQSEERAKQGLEKAEAGEGEKASEKVEKKEGEVVKEAVKEEVKEAKK